MLNVEQNFSRNCPQCNKIIFHTREYDCNYANKKQKFCIECSIAKRKSIKKEDKKFIRYCPSCNKEVKHNSQKLALLAKEKKCNSCAITFQWKNEGKISTNETRFKRNKSISNRRQDTSSAYHTKEFKEKQSIAHKNLWGDKESSYNKKETLDKWIYASKEMWERKEYREKRLSSETLSSFSKKMKNIWKERYSEFVEKFKKSWEDDDRRELARQRFNKLLELDEFKEKLWGNSKVIRVSKLELKIKDQLENIGFIHSSIHNKYFNRCLPDFLNEDSKEIIEIYGDYWHCNPNINKPYSNPDWYHNKLHMHSSDKWMADALRKSMLEEFGYKVYVLWEHDIKETYYDLNKIKILIDKSC